MVGYIVLENPPRKLICLVEKGSLKFALTHIDVLGSFVLVVALFTQPFSRSLGGNQLAWSSPCVVGALAASVFFLGIFGSVETTTKTVSIVPLRMLRVRLPVSTQITN
jgi:hypothetical protein